MSYNLVDPTTGDLTRVAGGTLYADLPIGSWIKNDMGTLPSGFLKEGDAILQSEYPELYVKYGSTVPYKADTSELSEYEPLTIGTNSGSATTALYDGIFRLNPGTCEAAIYYVSTNGGTTYSAVGASAGGGTPGQNYSSASTLYVKKGWKFYTTVYENASSGGLQTNGFIAYYKKSLIVKAKQVAVPADFMNAIGGVVEGLGEKITNYTVGNGYTFTGTIVKFGKLVFIDGRVRNTIANNTGGILNNIPANVSGVNKDLNVFWLKDDYSSVAGISVLSFDNGRSDLSVGINPAPVGVAQISFNYITE